MRRRRAFTTVALAATCLPACPAVAAQSHAVDITLKETGIYETPGPGSGPPSLVVEAGVVRGSLGTGVNRTDLHLRAGNGTRVFYDRHGSMRGSFVFGGVHKSNGDTIVGTLTITGGTGRYAHAHGKLHIDGFHNDKTGYSTEHITGPLTY
jgi:hypothetical protein